MLNVNEIIAPNKLWTRSESLASPSPVPKKSGIYGWFFKSIPPKVPKEGCTFKDGLALLYVGISPKAPPQNGRPPSKQKLKDRICYHYRGNAEGSTLRLTLGVLLSNELGLELRRVGSGKRMTFQTEGENRLSEWLSNNAFVTWTVHHEPWVLETEVIRHLSLPLNLAQNKQHAFFHVLTTMRKEAKTRAREMPIAD